MVENGLEAHSVKCTRWAQVSEDLQVCNIRATILQGSKYKMERKGERAVKNRIYA